MFDRAYHIQTNTLEIAMLPLPSLWIYAGLIGDLGASVSGDMDPLLFRVG
jgi:hypothetical protein